MTRLIWKIIPCLQILSCLSDFILELEAETETLPATEMGGQDKVSVWLSAQNGGDSPESSIEVMREEVITGKRQDVFPISYDVAVIKWHNVMSKNCATTSYIKHGKLGSWRVRS